MGKQGSPITLVGEGIWKGVDFLLKNPRQAVGLGAALLALSVTGHLVSEGSGNSGGTKHHNHAATYIFSVKDQHLVANPRSTQDDIDFGSPYFFVAPPELGESYHRLEVTTGLLGTVAAKATTHDGTATFHIPKIESPDGSFLPEVCVFHDLRQNDPTLAHGHCTPGVSG